MSLKNLGDVSYFRLNNEINRPVNGQIPLHKDKEALRAFFLENVKPNSMAFNSITDKINYLIENDYIESEFIGKYEPAFIEKLSAEIHSQKFRFQSFMAATSSTNNMPSKQTMASLTSKVLKIVFYSTPFTLLMVMKT